MRVEVIPSGSGVALSRTAPHSDYQRIIRSLADSYEVRPSQLQKSSVNFSGNVLDPRHNWFFYKEAYSASVVNEFLIENKIPAGATILDPFSGVGTTLLEAQKQRIRSIGFDINPVAHFVSTVKNEFYSANDLRFASKYLKKFSGNLPVSLKPPKYKKFTSLFSVKHQREMLVIKGFFEACPNSKIRGLLKLAYLSLVGQYANRIKDGNGLKLRKNYCPPKTLYVPFREMVERFISDLRIDQNITGEYRPIQKNDSVLRFASYPDLRRMKCHGAIFSPPYPNCFDYFEVYKLEMWLGEFVQDFKEFRPYRDVMVRSAVNCKFAFEIKNRYSEVDALAKIIGECNLWNDRIPAMIRGYFDDMANVLQALSEVLQPASPVSIVIANSSYQGIVVPTDALFCRIAETLGYTVDGIERVRQIRGSSQQMSKVGGLGDLMRESVVKLRTAR